MSKQIQINMTNKWLYLILTLLVLTISGLAVLAYNSIPNPGHGADTTIITINGVEKTLQAAIDDGSFDALGSIPCNWVGWRDAMGDCAGDGWPARQTIKMNCVNNILVEVISGTHPC